MSAFMKDAYKPYLLMETAIGAGRIKGPADVLQSMSTSKGARTKSRWELVKKLALEAYFVAGFCKNCLYVSIVFWMLFDYCSKFMKPRKESVPGSNDLCQIAVIFEQVVLILVVIFQLATTKKRFQLRQTMNNLWEPVLQQMSDTFGEPCVVQVVNLSRSWQMKLVCLNLAWALISIVFLSVMIPAYLRAYNVFDQFAYNRMVIAPDIFAKSTAMFTTIVLGRFNEQLEKFVSTAVPEKFYEKHNPDCRDGVSPPSLIVARILERFHGMRNSIVEASAQANKLYAWSALVQTMWFWINISLNLFQLAKSNSGAATAGVRILYAVFVGYWIVVNTEIGESLIQENNRTFDILQKFKLGHLPASIGNQVNLLSASIHGSPIEYSCNGFVTFSRRFLVEVTSLVVTYFFILLQFPQDAGMND